MFLELFKLFFKNIIPLNNPLKIVTVAILVASLVFNVIIVSKLSSFYTVINKECPSVLKKK